MKGLGVLGLMGRFEFWSFHIWCVKLCNVMDVSIFYCKEIGSLGHLMVV